MPANKIKLDICGSTYVISTSDNEEYVLSLASRMEKDINGVLNDAPSASLVTATVLTALSYLDELEKSTKAADNMRAQIRDYLEDASKAKLSADEARREVERLKREINSLKSR